MSTPTDDRIIAAAVRLFVEKGPAQLTMSELAQVAKVARGTLYRSVQSMEELFDRIVSTVSADLHRRVSANFVAIDDPAVRLAIGVRLWVRYAHENPAMGRFAVRFGLDEGAWRTWMVGPPMADFSAGVKSGRYTVTPSSVDSVASLILGTTVSAMWLVLEGHQTWRGAGSSAAELLLRALGIDSSEACTICSMDLPDLPSAP